MFDDAPGTPIGPVPVEAEQAVLGSALTNGPLLDRLSWLDPERFGEPVHGRVWAEMLRLRREGRPATPVTLKAAFDRDPALANELGGAAYLKAMVMAAQSVADAEGYAREVVRGHRLRALAAIGRRLVEEASDPAMPRDPAEIAGALVPEIEAVAANDDEDVGRTLLEIASDLADDALDPKPLIVTGVAPIDRALGGGLPQGFVMAIESRPGLGKTMSLMTMGLGAAERGANVAYLALEMGDMRLGQRVVAQYGQFQSQWFKRPDDRLLEAIGRVAKRLPANFRIINCQGITASTLKAKAYTLIRKLGIDLIILDYFQLVTPDGPCKDMARFYEDLSGWLATCAYKNPRARWLVASQENREGHTLGSDGLLRNCDWKGKLKASKVPFFRPDFAERFGGDGMLTTLYLDPDKDRDGGKVSIGTDEEPLLYTDPRGPHLGDLAALKATGEFWEEAA